ncbi:hypothetical protein L0F51_04130 [Afifella sp. H1R]|uniref:hypothetical protein n=1 Tax=Afifella sp. H1R TaxID=2908841 RepID=UPI001F3F55D8|nr:hypothetical protein [Afifella sp. H1R]MCF1502953.1 hypothetical protein [Afifella sp. H1R]
MSKIISIDSLTRLADPVTRLCLRRGLDPADPLDRMEAEIILEFRKSLGGSHG